MVSGTILFSLVLVRAPALLGSDPPLAAYALSLIPFCVAIASLTLFHRASWRPATAAALAVAYVVMILVAALRGGYLGAVGRNAAALEAAQLTLIALLGLCAFVREGRSDQRARYIRSLCWAPVVFLGANVVLFLGGIVPPGEYASDSGYPATMLHLVGVEVNRVLFPMSGGLNGIGPTAVAALVVCATLAYRNEQRRVAIMGAFLSLYVILAIDSRGALLFAGLALALVLIAPKARTRGVGWIVIVLPVLPIVLILALTGLAETDVGASLNRSASENITTGTGRTVVWNEVLAVLEKPEVDQIFGYGQNGQITSGASINYAYLFRDDPDPLSHTAHNLLLQTVLDIGWVGLLCLIVLIGAVLSRLVHLTTDHYFAALFVAAVALLLLGVVQADPTPAHPDSFAFWILLIFAALRESSLPPATHDAARARQHPVHMGDSGPVSHFS